MISTLVVLVLAIPSDPYVRSKVRPGGASDHCLYWPQGNPVVWQPNKEGNPETPGDTEFDALRAAFKTWNDQFVACGNLTLQEGPLTTSRDVGWFMDASVKNENIVVFRQKKCSDVVPATDSCLKDDNDADDCGNKYDCWQHQSAAIALTTTTYDPASGRILDADIELNEPSFIFSTVDTPKCSPPLIPYSTSCVAWDLQNTVTHEIGHFVGLDHTAYPNSTMNPTAPPGELSKRVLDPGTASFVCAAYPSGQPSKDCVIIPYSGTLGSAHTGCSAAPDALLLVPLALYARRRRRP